MSRHGNTKPRQVSQKVTPAPAPTTRVALPKTLLEVLPDAEYEKLWRHVSVGTGTCISMLEAYAALDMPGIPEQTLIQFRDRLNVLVEKAKGESNASNDS